MDCNEQLARLLGYTVPELWGVAVANLIVPEDRKQVLENIHHKSNGTHEYGMLRKDGTRAIVEIHSRPVAANSSRRHTAVRDITAYKQAETALRQLNLDLTMKNAELHAAHDAALNLMQDTALAADALRESEDRIQQALRVSHSYTFEWTPATDQVRRSAVAPQFWA